MYSTTGTLSDVTTKSKHAPNSVELILNLQIRSFRFVQTTARYKTRFVCIFLRDRLERRNSSKEASGNGFETGRTDGYVQSKLQGGSKADSERAKHASYEKQKFAPTPES